MELPVHQGQGLAEGVGDVTGQAGVQLAPAHPGAISWQDGPRPVRGAGMQEVLHPLGGGGEIFAAVEERSPLPLLLKAHPGQHVLPGEVLRRDAHQKAAVDVGPVPGAQAHAVGHQFSGGGGGGHHLTAGADAEGEGGPAGGQVTGQLIVRGGQPVGGGAILGQADGALIVLNAHADGEGLFLHGHPRLGQHGEGVTGGVAGGQDQSVAGQGIGPLGPLHREGGQRPAGLLQPGQPVPKAHIAAQGDQLLADVLHRLAQHVGADVGLVGPAHVRRGPGLDQGVQHRSDAGVVGAGGQLAVGEGAGAPLAELHVGGAGQLPGAPEVLHVLCALLHRAAPLQHDGL